VARKHSEVSQLLFSDHSVESITNGVHPPRWTSAPFQELFDLHIPDWRRDNSDLRYASGIPLEEIARAHQEAKRELIGEINGRADPPFDSTTFTVGFARRATPYKRADLLLDDVQRLQKIAQNAGAIQIVYAGKAHRRDHGGKELIRKIFALKQQLRDPVRLAYLEEYDMELGRLLTAGSDLWLNTPEPPLEASGTSGMKAALNGVPSLSILDGWWTEGHIEGVTGWAIGERSRLSSTSESRAAEAKSMYEKLESIVSLYYNDSERYRVIMRHAISLNGSFFNTQRMIDEYAKKAYRLGLET
jgi:starch phosphorylase